MRIKMNTMAPYKKHQMVLKIQKSRAVPFGQKVFVLLIQVDAVLSLFLQFFFDLADLMKEESVSNCYSERASFVNVLSLSCMKASFHGMTESKPDAWHYTILLETVEEQGN